jgi:GNAT superfamily N-acetyltransferase
LRLREISPDVYASDVLSLTAPLWAGRRGFDQYVAQTLEIARSRYGRRHYRTIGLYDGRKLLSSFKQYERSLWDGSRRLRAIGFGAVFTPVEYRGRGYASFMLAMALDRARDDGCALAYLFSDIAPAFYAALGFRALPSRELSLRADSLPTMRLQPSRLAEGDWNGVRHVYELGERGRGAGFLRTPTVWEWIQMRIRHGSEHPEGDETNLVVRRRHGVCAYVLGVRIPKRDTYVMDEFGFADAAAAAAIPSLLRAAAGDLRRITGWLPPAGARDLLRRGTLRKRKRPILMVAPLHSEGRTLLEAAGSDSRGGFCWATEHV